MSENLAKQPGSGRTMKEALSDFQRKWYSHLVLFPPSFSALVSAFFCISRYSLGCLSPHISTWLWRAEKLALWLIPHTPPLPPFSSHISLPLGRRDVCEEAPKEGSQD